MKSQTSRKYLVRISCAVAVGYLALSPSNAAAQVKLDVLTRDGYGVAPFRRPNPNTLLARGTINGRTADLVVDTGCAFNGIIVDESYAAGVPIEATKERGRAISGQSLSFRKGTAKAVTLGNAQLVGVPLYFGAIQGLRDAEVRKSIGAEGFIGAGFLKTCSAVIDLHNLRLYLKPPGKGKRAVLGQALQAVGLAEVPFEMVGDACLVNAEINGTPGKMLIDTGAYAGCVDTRFASRASLTENSIHYGINDASGNTIEAQLAHVSSFKIGGVNIPVPKLFVNNFSTYAATKGAVVGIIGMDILGPNWAIIDFGQQKLYIAKGK